MSNSKKRVLIAENTSDFGVQLRECLTDWGLSVSLVEDGRKAWKKLNNSTGYDLAFLNAVLPGMLGIDIIEKIREESDFNDLKIILIGALNRAERYHTPPSNLYGADGYIEDIATKDQILKELKSVADFELKDPDIEPSEETKIPGTQKEKAIQVARNVLREIINKYPEKTRKGIKEGSFYEILDEQIMKAKIKYNRTVSNKTEDGGKDHFFSTINAFLKIKRNEFKEKDLIDNAQ